FRDTPLQELIEALVIFSMNAHVIAGTEGDISVTVLEDRDNWTIEVFGLPARYVPPHRSPLHYPLEDYGDMGRQFVRVLVPLHGGKVTELPNVTRLTIPKTHLSIEVNLDEPMNKRMLAVREGPTHTAARTLLLALSVFVKNRHYSHMNWSSPFVIG